LLDNTKNKGEYLHMKNNIKFVALALLINAIGVIGLEFVGKCLELV
jgi:hypothetical protein